MSSSELIKDLLKFIITGVIAFVVSLLYTNYRLMPRYNITLVPLSITLGKLGTSDTACTVDRAKLTAAINRTNESKSTPFSPDSYVTYLKTLSPYELVLQDIVPQEFRPSLEKEEILLCNKSFEPSADITLEAAAMFREPTPYLMRRVCSMSYANVEFPIRAAAERQPVESPIRGATEGRAISHRFVEPETLLIRETTRLMFAYTEEDPTATSKLADLAQKVDKEDIKLSVKCSVISIGSETYTAVGGQSYPVEVSFSQ
jgi:hypothetical protein